MKCARIIKGLFIATVTLTALSSPDAMAQPLSASPTMDVAPLNVPPAMQPPTANIGAPGIDESAAKTKEEDPNALPVPVTEIADDLKKAEDDVSLEDVARTQDALARLDLLLSVERKINELQKTREERKTIGKSLSRENAGMPSLPASAFALPYGGGGGMPQFQNNGAGIVSGIGTPITSRPAVTGGGSMNGAPSIMEAPVEEYKLFKVTGANGTYRAIVTDSSEKQITISQGDKLGVYTVSKISATGVTLADKKKSKVLTIDNGGVPMMVHSR